MLLEAMANEINTPTEMAPKYRKKAVEAIALNIELERISTMESNGIT